ncbi:MAG TPA: spore germination protein GerW family protein [Anaerolineales bacterium]|nr:spore germination protein GerW family protein [Anaerolineales bacterium]
MTALSNLEPEGNISFDPNRALNTIQTTLDTFLNAADVEAVYGPPVSQGENVVIPAAEVLSIVGFGLGSGGGSQGMTENANTGSGGGGGGGGRVLARPVAAIVISPMGVRVESIVDVTKIAVAAFTTLGFMAALLTRMKRTKPPKLDV